MKTAHITLIVVGSMLTGALITDIAVRSNSSSVPPPKPQIQPQPVTVAPSVPSISLSSSALVGHWVADDGTEELKFFPDGTGACTVISKNKDFSFEWRMTSSRSVDMIFRGYIVPMQIDLNNGFHLYVTLEGERATYTKVTKYSTPEVSN